MPDLHDFSVKWSALDAVLPDLSRLAAFLGPGDFPEFFRAAEAISADAELRYKGYLLGSPTPDGKAVQHPSGATAKGVTREQNAAFGWTIANKAPSALTLEEGADARDMKSTLFNGTSKRARRAKDGSLYLVIPFRQGVPGTRGLPAMPKEVYALAKKMGFARVNGAPTTRVSATNWVVPKWTYRWHDGDPSRFRLTQAQIATVAGPDVAKRLGGMVRMAKSGHTSYMTFRVMSTKSPADSWQRKAQPALWPLRWAVDQAMAAGMPQLEDAIIADLWGALGQARDSQ